MSHWFDGLAMLHRFAFGDGDVDLREPLPGERRHTGRRRRTARSPTRSSPPTRAARSSGGVSSLFSPKLTDNANVNLVKLGERFIAMTETPIPVEFDADDAGDGGRRLRRTRDPDDRPSSPRPGEQGMLNYSAKLGPRNQYRFFLLAPGRGEPRGDRPRAGRASPPTCTRSGSPSAGSCSPSSRSSSTRSASPLSGRPYIENYRWKPELGTRFTLVDRATGEASGPFETDAASASTT